jgi:hypothetical protein
MIGIHDLSKNQMDFYSISKHIFPGAIVEESLGSNTVKFGLLDGNK